MKREIIATDKAPQAIGTYSQAVKVGATVYLSGQIPLVPESMELVQGDMEAQIRRVFDNLSAVCVAAGGSLADIANDRRFGPGWTNTDAAFWSEFNRTHEVGKGIQARLMHDPRIRDKGVRPKKTVLYNRFGLA